MWLHSSVGRATHRPRGGHGFESRWSPDFFFQASSFQIYCDDHSSLSSSYYRSSKMNYFIYFTSLYPLQQCLKKSEVGKNLLCLIALSGLKSITSTKTRMKTKITKLVKRKCFSLPRDIPTRASRWNNQCPGGLLSAMLARILKQTTGDLDLSLPRMKLTDWHFVAVNVVMVTLVRDFLKAFAGRFLSIPPVISFTLLRCSLPITEKDIAHVWKLKPRSFWPNQLLKMSIILA